MSCAWKIVFSWKSLIFFFGLWENFIYNCLQPWTFLLIENIFVPISNLSSRTFRFSFSSEGGFCLLGTCWPTRLDTHFTKIIFVPEYRSEWNGRKENLAAHITRKRQKCDIYFKEMKIFGNCQELIRNFCVSSETIFNNLAPYLATSS